ncbi:DUF3347 domain-containing protein [Elizabethkingia argentiflava]|uniref:DUF3347 domain-containing protein n=1 Tax=Elizabethkingia argenteiflava TaxID=2681556 RepID=A0A845PSN4_9FLAO|nr:DUF3347 domain-containing protein [Elizabethkingia argenteiflava]NAW50051.1 DUF3347 domain-containing protein [Elizabethkingia argenteiflava]
MKNRFLSLIFLAVSIMSFAQESNSQIQKLYQHYTAIKNALVQDDVAKAASAAKLFLKVASTVDFKVLSEDNINKLRKDAGAIAEASHLTTQRNYFFNLSDNMALIAEHFKISSSPIYIQYCPMAKGQWLSNEQEIKNPYYGSSMMTCGTLKAEISK